MYTHAEEAEEERPYSVRQTRAMYEQLSNSFHGSGAHPPHESARRRTAPLRHQHNHLEGEEASDLLAGLTLEERRRPIGESPPASLQSARRLAPHTPPQPHYHEPQQRLTALPFSYNLRKNIPPDQHMHTVAQYYPVGQSHFYSPAPVLLPRATSPRHGEGRDFDARMAENSSPFDRRHGQTSHYDTRQGEVRQEFDERIMVMQDEPGPSQLPATPLNDRRNHGTPNRGAPNANTVVAVPETDILDSSCSEEEDVVQSCADESNIDRAMDYENDAGASSSEEADDPEIQALFEREQIVDKYAKGPEQEGIDPWENPDFELYQKTDRFGFIHHSQLTEDKERREQIKERRRCLKWDAMYKEWEHRTPVKMAQRIWKGIPDSYRLRAWAKLLNIEAYKQNHLNLYNELLARAQLLSKDIKQIDLDVNRTYRDNVAFMKRYDVSQRRLFNILTAYSMFNTEVGYCQGMNHICAILIMYLSEDEDAFWGLHSLLCTRKYSMHGFFVPSFPKLRRFEDHFLHRILPKYAPRLQKHFDAIGLPPIYLPKWWFGCFLDRIPFRLCLRVWDVYLYFGDCVLMAMALNIMKMHQRRICKMGMEQFMDFIQRELPDNFGYTDDEVLDSLRKWLEKLQDDKMALPPRKEDQDVQELPNQPLGQVLKRSLVDIRMDIAELHSRSSRANSLAGRSPALRNRRSRRTAHDASSLSQSISALPSHNAGNQSWPSKKPASVATATTTTSAASRGTPPMSGADAATSPAFRRQPSSLRGGQSNGRAVAAAPPPPIPDADGFVPLAARNRHSVYDNVAPAPRGGRDDRVHRTANNVTYVSVDEPAAADGDDHERPRRARPAIPPPDYDRDDFHPRFQGIR